MNMFLVKATVGFLLLYIVTVSSYPLWGNDFEKSYRGSQYPPVEKTTVWQPGPGKEDSYLNLLELLLIQLQRPPRPSHQSQPLHLIHEYKRVPAPWKRSSSTARPNPSRYDYDDERPM